MRYEITIMAIEDNINVNESYIYEELKTVITQETYDSIKEEIKKII